MTRVSASPLAWLIRPLLLVMATLLLAPAAQAAIVIQGDSKLGRFAVQRDGTLQGAIEAFGDPATLRRHPRFRQTCYAGWPEIGRFRRERLPNWARLPWA